ncbi:MAG TPA: energy transducer TonB [Methylomirabilota bacterium]|nr:energy transducer TonB [Methylomirabilota bacterium]
MKWRIPLPEDRTQRALGLAIITSLLFHLFVLVPFVVVPGLFQPTPYVKRGEPLLVDIAPERPEEKAPLGNPSRPVAPPESASRQAAPAPKLPPAPPRAAAAPPRVAPAPRPAPVPPAPPREIARAQPAPEPAPQPMVKTPDPTPPAPETEPSEEASSAPGASPPSGPQVAVARPPSIWRQPGGGGGLQGGGRGGVDGAPIPLGTPEPKYLDYFNTVRERIKSKWVYPRPAGERGIEGELLIEFHIAKDGRLEFIELRHSSGTQILDDAALTAVKLAQPFPPVPDDIAKRTLAINGQFRYQIVSGFVNQFLR